ncbi:rCG54744 [Rattus norvegicus]|uniref:RCG54744 n=1 Tax=Rattus norvegicus TaxID=10116 RepID=A6KUD8_RAT|nr:rCG54744 [Rattus norvegicus]
MNQEEAGGQNSGGHPLFEKSPKVFYI